ncbi:MAG: S9 family peptidase, partial [Candidatus Eisenbacteria bacterium]|nr:S9 family peptidase [Candidatus Eisenbacteria bacterium]
MSFRFWVPIFTAVFSIFAVSFIPGSAHAVSKRPLAVHDVVMMATPQQADFSPDGDWIAYVLRTADLDKNQMRRQIYLASRRGGKPRAVTRGNESAQRPDWSPNGSYLAFLRKPDAPGAKETDDEQLWLLPMGGGEPFPLTNLGGGILDYAWTPDGRSILVLTPEDQAAGMKEYAGNREEKGYDADAKDKNIPRKILWRYPVPEGDPKLLFRGDRGMEEFELSPDGQWVAYLSNLTGVLADENETEIYLLGLNEERIRRLTHRYGAEGNIHWTHDGEGVICTAVKTDSLMFSQMEVYVLPVGSRRLDNRDHVPFSRWIPWTNLLDREVDAFLWPAKSGAGFVIAQDHFSARLATLDGEGTARWLTDPRKVIQYGAVSDDGKYLALTIETPESPAQLVLVNYEGRIARVLDEPNKDRFKDIQPAWQSVYSWNSFDGQEIEGLLIQPWWTEVLPPYPLIVDIHGGPSWHVTHELSQTIQTWAGEGYLVLAPNYRGSTGYGNEFSISNVRDLGGGDYRDIMAGVDQLIADGIADPYRIAIMGGSYGGYMANWAITQSSRFAAAVSEYGIFSLITDFSMSDYPMWEKSYLRKYYWDDLGAYLQMSPVFHAENVTTPVLIMHGEADNNTFISNSMEMYRMLRTLGKTVEFHQFPREGHGFAEPAHKLEEMRLARSWFDRFVTHGAIWPPEYNELRKTPREHLPPFLADQIRSIDDLPRLYRPGDTLSVNRGTPLQAIVGEISTPSSYGDERPGGRFVEVEILLSHQGWGMRSYPLQMNDVVMLGPSGRN